MPDRNDAIKTMAVMTLIFGRGSPRNALEIQIIKIPMSPEKSGRRRLFRNRTDDWSRIKRIIASGMMAAVVKNEAIAVPEMIS